MTNLEALKYAYTELGGDAAEVAGITNNADVIAKIGELEIGGGGGGGAGGVYVETALNTSGEYPEYVSTTTAAAVIAALQAGSSVIFHVPASDYQFEMYLSIWGYEPPHNDNSATFLFGYGASWGNLTQGGAIGEDGYIHFEVYVD